MTILFEENEIYRSPDGHLLAREYDSLTPNGNRTGGRWVLRGPSGEFLDIDQYRHDIIERHGFQVANIAKFSIIPLPTLSVDPRSCLNEPHSVETPVEVHSPGLD